MAEALGVAASAIQIADIGVKLSQNIYSYVETVATADRRIAEIATKVEVTTAVIEELGHVFDDPEVVARCKASALATARRTLKECESIFKDIGKEVEISKKNRIMFPFKKGKFDRLSASLESFKSTLSLLMHILQHARQLLTEKEMRNQAEELIRARDEAEQMRWQRTPDKNQNPMGGSAESSTPLQIRALPRHFHSTGMQRTEETSEDPTPLREKIESRDVPLGVFTAAAINSVNVCATNSTMRNSPETKSASTEGRTPVKNPQRAQTSMLEECLDSLKQMMFKIELLQQALPTTQSLPAWAKENELAEASSGVKRKLGVIVSICERESEGPPIKRFARPVESSPSGSFALPVSSSSWKEDDYYKRARVRYAEHDWHGNHEEHNPHHRRPQAEGIVAGVGAAQLKQNHRKKQGNDPGCHVCQTLGYDALDAVGAEAISRRDFESRSRSEQHHHHHHHHHKRGRSHSEGGKVAGVADLSARSFAQSLASRSSYTSTPGTLQSILNSGGALSLSRPSTLPHESAGANMLSYRAKEEDTNEGGLPPHPTLTASSPSSSFANQPRRLHSMSISRILSPDHDNRSSYHQIPESSISSASIHPSYYNGSTSESVGDTSSRTLPRPSALVDTNLPPAPQSMMSQFTYKVSSGSQEWKEKADYLEEERERQANEWKSIISTAGSRDGAPESILESPSEMNETKTVPTLSGAMRETDTSGEPPLFPGWRGDKMGETAPLILTTGTVPEHANLIARQLSRDMITEACSPPTKEGHEASPAPRPSTPQHQQRSHPGTWMSAPLLRPPVPGAQSHSSPRARRLSLSIPPSPSVRPVANGHTTEDPQTPALQPHQQPLHGRPSQPKLLLATPSGSQATPQENGPRRGVCGLKLSIGGISASGSSDASAHSGSGRFGDNGYGGPPPLLNTTHGLSERGGARPSVDLRVDDGGSSTLDAGEYAMGYRSAGGTYLAPLIGGFLSKTMPAAEDGSSKIDALLREWTNVYD